MRAITLKKPEYIGTLPIIVERAFKESKPNITYAQKKTLMRQFVGRKFLDKTVYVLRSPGNKKRMISVDENLPKDAEEFLESPAIVRWVGDKGELVLEPLN